MQNNSGSKKVPDKLALISMPWQLYNRPSIQLGALKAYIEKNSSGTVHCMHPYLLVAKEIGPKSYQTIAQQSWAGEFIYSSALFPEETKPCRKLFSKLFSTKKDIPSYDLLITQVHTVTKSWINSVDFEQYRAVGFSVCFDQLLASLWGAKLIKAKYPELPIVFGGSACSAQLGNSLLECFEQIDFVIDGEGEEALLQLFASFISAPNSVPHHPAILTRRKKHAQEHKELNMQSLPVPDYSDYFSQLDTIFANQPFRPTLPVEFSRGCWWGKCTFCNLNLQWTGYRWKSAEQTAREVSTLATTFNCLDFTFTDNALPPKEAIRFFSAAAEHLADFSFFAEIRAITDPETLQLFAKGGLHSVQVGIEALSDSLLAKMKKGTRVIENLYIMKLCSQHNIQLDGNLIIEFPQSTADEVMETLENLEFCFPFRPLSTAKFFLGFASPIHQQKSTWKLQQRVHPKNRVLFPDTIIQKLDLIALDYTGDKIFQKKNWQHVVKKVAKWRVFHDERRKRTEFSCALSYRDGGNFLLIRQEQPNGEVLHHTLKGTSRKIYLHCLEIQALCDLQKAFPKIKDTMLVDFLQDLHIKRILFFDGGHALALAIHRAT